MSVYGLPLLVERVRASFVEDALAADPPTTPVPVLFGWSERAKKPQLNYRVVFVAGDDSGWTLGTISQADSPFAKNPKSLATLDEVWTCYLEARDVSDLSDETKQYEAARALYNAWFRALHYSEVPHSILSQRWVVDQTVRYEGAALRITGTVSARVPDSANTLAPVDTGASLTVRQLDVDQTISIPPPDEDDED